MADEQTYPIREQLERIAEGHASALTLEPGQAGTLGTLLDAVDDVLDWYRDNEAVPSLESKLKILWRRLNRVREINAR